MNDHPANNNVMKLRKKLKPHLKSLHLQQQDGKKSMQKYLLEVLLHF
jgi:hypothetical protein